MAGVTQVIKKIITFRDRMRERWVPPWLSRGNAEKFLYAISLQADIFGDALVAGVASRFPGVYGFESLSLIGRERRIARGPLESDETYALRLRRWLDDHRRRGGAYALLAQLHAYYAPDNFTIDLIYRSGRRFTQTSGGIITRMLDTAPRFDEDFARWARWWLIYVTDRFDLDTLTDAQIRDLKHVPREWNAAHPIGTLLVMTSDARTWDWPDRTWDADVTWDAPGAAQTFTIG